MKSIRTLKTNAVTLIVLATVWAAATPQRLHAAFTPGNLAVFSADTASANNTTFTILELSSSTANQSSAVNSIPINGATGLNALRTSGSATSTGYLADTDDGSLLAFAAHNSTNTSGNANTITTRGVGTLDPTGVFNLATTYTGTSGNQTRGATSVDNATWFIGDQGGVYSNGSSAASPTANCRAMKSFGGTVYFLQASSVATNTVVSTISAATGGTITGLPGLANNANGADFYFVSSGSNGSTFDVLYVLAGTNATTGTISKYSLVAGSWVANGSYTTGFGGFGLAASASGGGAVLYVTTGTGATAANSVIRLADSAGYNAAITIVTGNNVTLYTAAAGTTLKGIAFAPAPACVKPVAYSVTGGGGYCVGGGGVAVGLTNSETGVTYQLYRNGGATAVGSPLAGTNGSAISFGIQTIADTYTVVGTRTAGGCTANMTGSAIVTVNPIPSSVISAASSACPNSSGNIASVPATPGGTYAWTITNGTIEAGTNTPTISYHAGASGSVLLGCQVTSSAGCSSNASSAVVSISAAVVTTAANGGPYCAGQTIVLSASGDAGDNYSWTGPNGFTSSVQNPIITNASLAKAGSYTVTRTAACGVSAPSSTTVAVSAIPSSTISAASAVCANSTNNVATVPDAGLGASYGWTISGGTITAGANTRNITFSAGASGSVLLSSTVTNSSGCFSNASTATVTINPIPNSTITVPNLVLVNSTNTATVADAGLGAAYAWSISGGSIIGGSNTASITFTAGGSVGTILLGSTVTVGGGCGSSSSASVGIQLPSRHLVVLRVGDGSGALGNAGTALFADQFNSVGALVQSLSLPTNGANALVVSGSATSEGGLMLSPDGRLLCFGGYSTNSGVASIASTAAAAVPRTVATLDGAQQFSKVASTTTQFDANNIRSAATDDAANYWAVGANSGTYYLGTASPAATIQSALANTRVISLLNGNLCFSVGAGSARGVYVFPGRPTTAQAATQLVDTTSSSSPYGFAIRPDGAVVYVADDRTTSAGGIQKWTFNGSTWSLAYTLSSGAANIGARGLTVDFSGSNAVIYATSAESSANRLIRIIDTGSGATPVTLATAPVNEVYRGVAFAATPGIIAQPADQTVCGGAPATFTAAAAGVPTPTAQWQVSTNNGTSFTDVGGATSPTSYSLIATSADTGKKFRVVYTNLNGSSTSTVATVTVRLTTASDFTIVGTVNLPFKLSEADLLSHASGDGGVVLLSVDAISANGVALTRSQGVISYHANLTNNDSFHYSVDSVTGGCPASGLVTLTVSTNLTGQARGVTVSDGSVTVDFGGVPGYSYGVQRSTNLVDWVTLLTTNAPADGVFTFTDNFSGPGTPPSQAFYRLRYNP